MSPANEDITPAAFIEYRVGSRQNLRFKRIPVRRYTDDFIFIPYGYGQISNAFLPPTLSNLLDKIFGRYTLVAI